MPIPKRKELYNQVLSIFPDETEEFKTKYVKKAVADLLDLTEDERNKLIARGETIIENNVGWAITYLKKAGLLESKRLGYVNITEKGIYEKKLGSNITDEYLLKFPSFVEFKDKMRENKKKRKIAKTNELGSIENQLKSIEISLFNNLLKKITNSDENILKKILIELFKKLDFHVLEKDLGVFSDNHKVSGIINHDRLGLNKLAICAINSKVNIQDLQNFAGFMVSNSLSKGIFITTSDFDANMI